MSSYQIELRSDTAANWTSVNPVLGQGEFGVELGDTPEKFKIGDGVSTWSELDYAGGVAGACGVSGVSGVQGACGVSGVAGACGVSGVPGACGVSGAGGGACGVSGVAGACGVSGVAGACGHAGACGVSGVAGACGVSGVAGACGVSGVSGVPGGGGGSAVAPSGDETGATDATNINAVLTAGGVAVLDGAYYIDTGLELGGANGLDMSPNTVIYWKGAANTTAIGTVAFTSGTQAAFTGVLLGGALFYPQASITEAMACVFVAQPEPSQPITMAVGTGTGTAGAPVSGAYGYDFDGCTNPGPFKVNANVYGQFEAAFHVRCSHVTIDTCASAYGAHHVEVDEDSLATSAGPPYNVSLIGANHGYDNSASFLHLVRATSVVVNGGFNEGQSETPVNCIAESTFEGWCDFQDVHTSTGGKLTHYSTTGKVRYRDTQDSGGSDGFYDDVLYYGQESGVPVVALSTITGLGYVSGISGEAMAFSGSSEYTFDNHVVMTDLPTSDPGVAGELWNDSGIIHISAG